MMTLLLIRCGFQSHKIDDLMKDEIIHLQVVIYDLHVKHKEYDDMIESYSHSHSVDQFKIKRIAGIRTFSPTPPLSPLLENIACFDDFLFGVSY